MTEPDATGALIVILKAATAITAKTGPVRIAPFLGSEAVEAEWAMPNWAITLNPVGGLPGQPALDLADQRYDLTFYGPGKTAAIRAMNAGELWRITNGILVPTRASGASGSFHAANTLIQQIFQDGGRRTLDFPDDWTKVSCSYIVRYSRIPLA